MNKTAVKVLAALVAPALIANAVSLPAGVGSLAMVPPQGRPPANVPPPTLSRPGQGPAANASIPLGGNMVSTTLPQGPVQWSELQALEVRLKEDVRATNVTVFVANSDTLHAVFIKSVAVIARDSNRLVANLAVSKVQVMCSDGSCVSDSVGALHTAALGLVISARQGDAPFEGYMIITYVVGDSAKKTYSLIRAIHVVDVPQRAPSTFVVISALVGALCTLGMSLLSNAWRRVVENETWDAGTPGAAEWHPSASWATNLAVLGGVVTTLMGVAFLSDQTADGIRSSFSALATVLSILGVLGAAMYTLIGGVAAQRSSVRWERFAIALGSVTVLWAAYGQLFTMLQVLREMAGRGVMQPAAALSIEGLLGLVALCVGGYAYESTWNRTPNAVAIPPVIPGLPVDPNKVDIPLPRADALRVELHGERRHAKHWAML